MAGKPADGAWRSSPEFRAAVTALESAEDRRARELADLDARHALERDALLGGHS
jgi:hypothetical protein